MFKRLLTGTNLGPSSKSAKGRTRSLSPRRGLAASKRACLEALEPRQLLSATYYVSTAGSNSNPGTLSQPFLTIQQAANAAVSGDTVDIEGGTYRETVTPPHSGVTFTNYGGQTVTVSAANLVTGSWSTTGNPSTYQTTGVPNMGQGNNQVFVDQKLMNDARWPNTSLDLSHPRLATANSVSNSGGTYTLNDATITQPAGFWSGSTIHIAPGNPAGWVNYTGTVSDSGSGWIKFTLPGDTNLPAESPTGGNQYYLTGTSNALDTTGEFYISSSNSLSLSTPNGDSPASHTVEVKARLYTFDLSSASNTTIEGIDLFAGGIQTSGTSSYTTVNGVTITYGGVYGNITKGWLDATNAPGSAAISLLGSNSTVENCTINFSAGSGVFVDSDYNTVTGNHINDTDYSGTDQAPIFMPWDQASYNAISSNTIQNAGRDGINDRGRSNQLTHNTILYFMLQTSDGGGIYTNPNGRPALDGTYSYNTISHGHVSQGYNAVGVYLDDNSAGFHVDDNVTSDVDSGFKANSTSLNETITENDFGGSKFAMETNGSYDWSGTTITNNVFGNPATSIADSFFGEPTVNYGTGATSSGNLYVPTGPTVTGTTSSSVALSWSADLRSAGASVAGYAVYRKGPGGSFQQIATTASTVTTFQDNTASPSTTYSYAVAAVHSPDNWQTGLSNPVSAITQGGPTGTASFVKVDTTTEGTWTGVYGADGYALPGSGLPTHYPSYVQVTPSGQNGYIWNPSPQPTDVQAPQTAPSSSTRIAAQDYAPGSFSYQLNFTDGQTHQVALYLLDWDNTNRAETLTVTDVGSGAVLDPARSASGFYYGEYFVWNLSGDVKITITRTAGDNATVSGLFFGTGAAYSNAINAATAGDSIALALDSDGLHIDWSAANARGQVAINDPAGLTINGDANTDTVTLNEQSGAAAEALPQTLHLNGTFNLDGLGTTMLADPLAGHTIDVERSTVYVQYSASSSLTLALVQKYLVNGFNGGSWNGTSNATTGVITTSDAALDFDIGYADNSDGTGVDPVANTVELKYTVNGDTNLDGSANLTDLQTLTRNFGKSAASWDQGDLNYDGSIGLPDYLLLTRHFGDTINTWFVTSAADDGSSGTLRYAITHSPAGAVITFSPSIFTGAVNTITLATGQLEIAHSLTLTGPGSSYLTISGNNASRIFQIDAGVTASLSGMTLTQGNAGSGNGGGINDLGTLTLSNSVLENSTASHSGALYILQGVANVTNCTFSNNSATTYDGAVGCDTGTTATFTGCTFNNNTAVNGGGAIVGYDNSLTLINDTFTGNSATAGPGGAIDNLIGTCTITNCTIVGNSSTSAGGGIYAGSNGPLTLNNTIVAKDTTNGSPSDIAGLGVSASSAYNLVGDGSGALTAANHNLLGSTSNLLDPMLGALALNGGTTETMMPLTSSPVIDAGSNALIPSGITTDQQGFARITNATVDTGACEFGSTS